MNSKTPVKMEIFDDVTVDHFLYDPLHTIVDLDVKNDIEHEVIAKLECNNQPISEVNITEQIVYVCGSCRSEFPTRTDFRNHAQKCPNKVMHSTSTHESQFEYLREYGIEELKQLQCEKQFEEGTTLIQDKLNYYAQKTYNCQRCGVNFKNRSTFRLHIVRHKYSQMKSKQPGLEELKCLQCGKQFEARKTLAEHELSHSIQKMYNCQQCEAKFKYKTVFWQHCLTHKLSQSKSNQRKSSGENSVQCSHSAKSESITKQQKSKTLVTHKCQECGKLFLYKKELKVHNLTIHSDKKQFKCEQCARRFSSSDKLKRHSVMHTDHKSFQCELCGRMFKQKCNMIIHSYTHAVQKPFKCTECGKEFIFGNHLERHMLEHSGIKQISIWKE